MHTTGATVGANSVTVTCVSAAATNFYAEGYAIVATSAFPGWMSDPLPAASGLQRDRLERVRNPQPTRLHHRPRPSDCLAGAFTPRTRARVRLWAKRGVESSGGSPGTRPIYLGRSRPTPCGDGAVLRAVSALASRRWAEQPRGEAVT